MQRSLEKKNKSGWGRFPWNNIEPAKLFKKKKHLKKKGFEENLLLPPYRQFSNCENKRLRRNLDISMYVFIALSKLASFQK